MALVGSYILPHPPILIPEIGRGEELNAKNTIIGIQNIVDDIKHKNPDTIIVITPHGPVFDDAVSISMQEKLYGDFRRFGNHGIKFEFNNNTELAKKIAIHANLDGIMVAEIDRHLASQFNISLEIDHGTLVPLYFVKQKYTVYKLVHITIGLLPYKDLYKFGMCIYNEIAKTDEKVVVIASADLSHCLLPDSPAGFNPKGKEFDTKIVSLIGKHEVEAIVDIDEKLVQNAGECGLRPIIMFEGVLDKYSVKPNILSYEGPFGVGYMTAKFETNENIDQTLYPKIISNYNNKISKIRTNEDEYIKLARKSVENYIKNNLIIDIPEFKSSELKYEEAGTFVSIKKHGKLRGCIGTIIPTKSCVAEEIIYNAISAATKDTRFYPIDASELDELIYSVDVLLPPEPVTNIEQLDVKKYGVIVKTDRKSGLLLPNLDGINSVQEQISIALNKAGIHENENYTIERFEVIRHD